MSNILSLKRRIQAAKNVSKTTKAMQMIAASKLKRAQDAVIATRPYVHKISALTANIMAAKDSSYTHPYVSQKTNTGKTLVLALSPDKGLCGSLVTNIIREFIKFQEQQPNTSYIVIGKKLEGQIVRFNKEIVASFAFGTTLPTFDMIYPLIKLIDEYYLNKKVDSVKILTTDFVNVFTQKPKIVDLLPISQQLNNETMEPSFSIYEPNRETLLNKLLTHSIEMTVYQQLLESFVSEQASRMMAMQNATSNANDIIDDLQLEYNKTRQAKITSEILDITGGANVARQ